MKAKEKSEEKNPVGRPSSFTTEMGDLICERMQTGESLRSICRDDDFPHLGQVIRWLASNANTGFRLQYAHSRQVGLEVMADDVLNIADQDPVLTPDGKIDNAGVQHQRLRVDTRKWILSKQLPKVYGDRTILAGDEDAPLNPLTNNERAAQAAKIINQAVERSKIDQDWKIIIPHIPHNELLKETDYERMDTGAEATAIAECFLCNGMSELLREQGDALDQLERGV